ncbi:hypothetical protein CLV84_2968 [Neolewinella xylanilytica]|uniref:Uncharacterized protein n=1 Tax=Neolewinella xylanilytica TaxID=1514080 RepID=A0A2S6I4N2_9BACT|nr:hypothetical protein CLV84_2968 [Neolewinella xylanilytica]
MYHRKTEQEGGMKSGWEKRIGPNPNWPNMDHLPNEAA